LSFPLPDFAIIVVGALFGAIIGGFLSALTVLTKEIAGGILRDLGKLRGRAISVQAPRQEAPALQPKGDVLARSIKITVAWAIVFTIDTAAIVWRVHWLAAQPVIEARRLDEWDQLFWTVNLTLGPCFVSFIAFQTFKILRTQASRAISIALSLAILVAHVAAFCPAMVMTSIIAHFAAGGIE